MLQLTAAQLWNKNMAHIASIEENTMALCIKGQTSTLQLGKLGYLRMCNM